ncbi:MAG: hypothetical protein AAGL49_02190, partial [Pseudomonadota bacterium]
MAKFKDQDKGFRAEALRKVIARAAAESSKPSEDGGARRGFSTSSDPKTSLPAPPVRVRPSGDAGLTPPPAPSYQDPYAAGHPGGYPPPPPPAYGYAAYPPPGYAPPPPPNRKGSAPKKGFVAQNRRELEYEQRKRATDFSDLMSDSLRAAHAYAEMSALSRLALVAASVVMVLTLIMLLMFSAMGGGFMPSRDVLSLGAVTAGLLSVAAFIFGWFSPNCAANRERDFNKSVGALVHFIHKEKSALEDAIASRMPSTGSGLLRSSAGGSAQMDLVWFEYQDFYRLTEDAKRGLTHFDRMRSRRDAPRGVIGFAAGFLISFVLSAMMFGGSDSSGGGSPLLLLGGLIAVVGLFAAGQIYFLFKSSKFRAIDSYFMGEVGRIGLK